VQSRKEKKKKIQKGENAVLGRSSGRGSRKGYRGKKQKIGMRRDGWHEKMENHPLNTFSGDSNR